MDENKIITEIYGRSIVRGEVKHKYLPGPHIGFFNSKALIHDEVIICEGIIDALSLISLGIKHVIAGYGISGFTEDMLKAFKESQVKKIDIAYDNDKNGSGDKAAKRLAEKLRELNINNGKVKINRIVFPLGMDANDFICKETR
jgi:DNA primase